MNGSVSSQRLFVWGAVGVLFVCAAIIAGCGGVGTGGTGSFTASISGKVADGYLANATVFLDKNGNYQLDGGEPFTTTDGNGAYVLDVDPADVGRYPIVALAIKGVAIDKDTNLPVTNSYLLSLPKNIVSDKVSNNFISPFTSLLREIMETGIYGTIQQATDVLITRTGLQTGTDMTSDYIAAGKTDMHNAAQNIATIMGQQEGQIFNTSGSTTTVDVNRYRGMMGTIFSNMSSVRGSHAQTGMSNLNSSMTTVLSNMPPTVAGQPFKNMSSSFRGMMVGGKTITGGMR